MTDQLIFCDKCGLKTDRQYGNDWFVLDMNKAIPVLRLVKDGHDGHRAKLCLACYVRELEWRTEQFRKTLPIGGEE
jgi:hypothetical protein